MHWLGTLVAVHRPNKDSLVSTDGSIYVPDQYLGIPKNSIQPFSEDIDICAASNKLASEFSTP